MINTSRATGPEIMNIIQKMDPVLDGLPSDHVYMAAISLALIIQDCEITPAKLAKGVGEVSNFIVAYLETAGTDGVVAAKKVN